MTTCTIDKHGLCHRHNVKHIGRLAQLAIEESERGEKYRKKWDEIYGAKSALSRSLPLLRSFAEARKCRHLGLRLTHEEVKEKQLSGCRTCSNTIYAFHCHLPDARKFNNGPYARIGGECMQCTDWAPKDELENLHQNNDPRFPTKCTEPKQKLRIMFSIEGKDYEYTIQYLGENLAGQIWHSHSDYATMTLLNQDGPNANYSLSLDAKQDGRIVCQIVAARLLLVECKPFYAVCGGILHDNAHHTAIALLPELAGKTWAATVAECPA